MKERNKMNVASLELCKELYEVSGWYFANHKWYYSEFTGLLTLAPADDDVGKTYKVVCPAYDLGYLIRKLPRTKKYIGTYKRAMTSDLVVASLDTIEWGAGYQEDESFFNLIETAATPEDACARLAIELFKQGVLTK